MQFLMILLGLLGITAVAGGGGSSSTSDSTAIGGDTPDVPDMPDMSDDDGGDDDGGEEDDDEDDDEEDGDFVSITAFGTFHGSSSHTMDQALEGGRTPITTEALEAYNGLRDFFGLDPVDLEEIGQWAFANDMTNNDEAYDQDELGVGLYYAMQGAKVGWISDSTFDPQLLADIQKAARLGTEDEVMEMVGANAHEGFVDFLEDEGLTETFINTLKMEPHYGGWMHGRTHGDLGFDDEGGGQVATAHDLNHLTVLSHDQSQPFMNDTFDYPQWPALDAPEADVANYFQSMVTLGDPHGEGIVEAESEAGLMSGGETLMATLSVVSTHVSEIPAYEEAADEEMELF